MALTMPTMLTIKQTAELTGLAQHNIRQLCLQNKICYMKTGNKYLINLEKFIEFLNTGEGNEPAPVYGRVRAVR